MKFAQLYEQWYKHYACTVAQDTAYDTNRYLNIWVIPKLGELDINDIKAIDIIDVANATAIKSTYYAKRAVSDIARIYDYARILDLTEKNPAYRLNKYIPSHQPKGHKFVATPKVSAMLKKIDRCNKSNKSVTLAFWMLVYTATRRQEAVLAKKSEFDFENLVWTIPSKHMKVKNNKNHIVPLSVQLALMLNEYFDSNDSIYAFPSIRIDHSISPWSPHYLLLKSGYEGKQTLHGFRKIFSTHAHSSGLWSIDAIELSLAHEIRGVRGVYNHAQYLDERAELMQWYADEVDKWRGLS